MTGHHRLDAPHRLDWVNQRGEPRPPLVRAPRWVLRLWKAVDHARYAHRYGDTGPSDGRLRAYYKGVGKGAVDGHGTEGDRETVRAQGRPQLLWRRHGGQR